MKNILIISFILLLLFSFSGCQKEEKDDVYPEIKMDCCGGFPMNCDEVTRGGSFTFVAQFSDNEELGAFSLDIHNNFDHHTHSTDPVPCELEPIKDPVNPFRLIEEYVIPSGSKTYLAEVEIEVPAGADTGDYHMMVRLTDKAGWQTLKGISFKVIE
ncbi:MAG: DUF4625 domain-containing protein [Bacteroidota bacterium]